MEFAFRMFIFFIVFMVGGVLLQIFLSKREAKWPGLVLPLLTFLYSLLLMFNVQAAGDGFPWGPVLSSLVLGNIPTVLLLAIYAACREKRRRNSDMDKMNIQDL